MAIKRPDIYEHNNPAYAIADSDFVRGGIRSAVADLASLYTLSGNTDQLKEHSTIVYVTGETKYYILVDIANVGNVNGWNEFQTGGGEGTLTGATNGIILVNSGTTVALGGSLTGDTTIDASGNSFNLTNIEEFQVSSGLSTVFGINNEGLSFSFSGGSVTFDDDGGLKYGADYSADYSARSIPDVSYITGLTSGYLKLDQTTPQNVTGSQPVFDEGITFGGNPTTSEITGHTVGRMYYDKEYETVSVDIGTETTLQLGQETLRYVYNSSGSIIPNGAVVRDTGVYTGGGVDTVTIGLAIASGVTTSNVIGMATQDIGINGFGYITTKGNVNGLNTQTSSQYSGMTEGDVIYLSPSIFGGVTNVQPSSPFINIRLGRLLTKDSVNGKVFVEINRSLSLNDITDVSAPSPSLDNVLKYNGTEWVNAAIGATSAGSGVNVYYATPILNSVSSPAGISQDGTSGNGIQIATFSRTPVTTGGTLIVAGLDASDIRAFAAWESINPIQRTTIDSGLWEFYDYVSVDNTAGNTYLIHGMYQIVPITGSTITTTGAAANSRTATITSGQFTGEHFNPAAINTEASYLKTPSGIYQITASASTNSVTITVPTGYVNETGVSGSTWNPLFTGSTISIEDTASTLYQTKITSPAFNVNPTDKFGGISFVEADGAITLSFSYNGTTNASFIITPLVTLHNDLGGLQGGTGTERYHTTLAQLNIINNTSGINTGDETTATIEAKLTGTISTHTHDYSNIVNTPDLSLYQSVSGFTGYTATTAPIIDNAITGATNHGAGTTVYTGSTGRNLQLNTFVGSGGTTVQKVGEEIVISSATASGSQLYSGETPTAVCVGGIDIGYELTGKTLSCIIQDLFVPELFQTSVGTPSTSLSVTACGIQEIGYNFTQTLTPSYSAGAITPLYCTDNGTTRGGAANNYSYTGPSVSAGFSGCTSCNIIGYVVTSGVQTWGVCTRYDEGACIKGSKGTVNPSYPTVCPQDSCTAAGNKSITGILPWYYGTKASGTITGSDITTGCCTKVVANVGASTPICFNVTAPTSAYLWFAAPTGTYTDKTKWWVCAANAGDIGGTGQLWKKQAGTVSVTSAQGCWAGCSFDVYVTCGATSTATNIPMCLYY